MKRTKIKQNSVKACISKIKPHYPISDLFLVVLIYILKQKRDVRKKFE